MGIKRGWNVLLGLALWFSVSSAAEAQTYTVDVFTNTTPAQVTSTAQASDGDFDVSSLLTGGLTLDNVSRVWIHSTTSSQAVSVGKVTVSGNRAGTTPILVVITRDGDFNEQARDPLVTDIANWRGISVPGSIIQNGQTVGAVRDTVRLSAAITGNLTTNDTAPSPAIRVGEIVRLQVSNEVRAPIEVTGTGTALGRLVARQVTNTSSIVATHGDIGNIEIGSASAHGDLRAGVAASAGTLGDVTVVGAIDIASPGMIHGYLGIGGISARSIASDICAGAGEPGSSDIGYIECYGPMTGNIFASRILGDQSQTQYAALIEDDFEGRMSIEGRLDRPIAVVGSMMPGSSIEVESMDCTLIRVTGNATRIVVRNDLVCEAGGAAMIDVGGNAQEIAIGGEVFGQFAEARITVGGVLEHLSIGGNLVGNLYALDASSPYCRIRHCEIGGTVIGTFDVTEVEEMTLGDVVNEGTPGLRVGHLPTSGIIKVRGACNAGIFVGRLGQTTLPLGGLILTNLVGDAMGELGSVSCLPVGVLSSYPDYSTPSSALGGGSIATVPFGLYATDCSPPHTPDWSYNAPDEQKILNTQFSHFRNPNNTPSITDEEITISIRGPVRTDAPVGTAPLTLWLWVHNSFWRDVTDHVEVEMKRGTDPGYSRHIVVRGNGQLLSPGYYAVVLNTVSGSPNRIYSDQTFVSPPPGLTPNSVDAENNPIVQYNFRLYRDCNKNDVLDAAGTDGCMVECIADYTDGNGNCLQPDGGVGIDDLLCFLGYFDNGVLEADVDDGSGTGTQDRGVGIEDLLYYLIRYDSGC